MVKDLFKQHLKAKLLRRKLGPVRYIAVDEFSIRERHHYMTVVLDLETSQILHAHEGRDAQALIPFLEKLKRRGANLKAVAMDLSPAYQQAVRAVFPDLGLVHDTYHVVALANRAIDETRRDMYRDLKGQDQKVINGSRFLLLRALDKLSPTSMSRLADFMEMNLPLYQAYLLKEDLRVFWNCPTPRQPNPSWVPGSSRPGHWATSISARSPTPWTATVPASWHTSDTRRGAARLARGA